MTDKAKNVPDNSTNAQEKRERELHEQSLSSNDPTEGRPGETQGTRNIPGQGGLSTDEPAEGDVKATRKNG